MSHPHTGKSWIELDHDLNIEPWESVCAMQIAGLVAPFEERPFDDDPMDDSILLFGCVMRRRLALRIALHLEDPDLVAGVLADTEVVDPDTTPDSRRTLFDHLEGVLPPEILTVVLLEHDDLEDLDMEDEDRFLDYAA